MMLIKRRRGVLLRNTGDNMDNNTRIYPKDRGHAFKIGYYQFKAAVKGMFFFFSKFVLVGCVGLFLWYLWSRLWFPFLIDVTNLTVSEGLLLGAAGIAFLVMAGFALVLLGIVGVGFFKVLQDFGRAGRYFLFMLFYPIYITRYTLLKWFKELAPEWKRKQKERDFD
jgi:hypothetical protein